MLPAQYKNKQIEPELGKKAEETTFPNIIRSEVNFLVLPFFALWDKDVKRRTRTEYKTVVERNEQKIEVAWIVSSNPEFGYPGPFDRKVHKAIEQIVVELPTPVQNPIPLGSLYSLCKRMGISSFGGKEYKKIKEALTRIITTTVISKGTFYSKEKKKWIEDIFHLYERIVNKGEELPNGSVADTNYLYLNSWYLDNINANYMKPVDWYYYKSLETPVAQRLYEILSVKFYGLLGKKGRFTSYKYSTICNLLPVARQGYLSFAKKSLDPAHKKLKDTGFLDDWTWENIPQKGKSNDWIIRYYPGRRAKIEIERFNVGEQLQFELPSSKEDRTINYDLEISATEIGIIEILTQRGITNTIAKRLVNSYQIEQIQKQIVIFDYLVKTKSPLLTKNPAGFLRKSIEENYQPPAEYNRKQERELAELKRTQEKIEKEA